MQYAPIDPGADSIIIAYILVSVVTGYFTVIMLKKWLKRKAKAPQLLFFTFLSYFICIVVTLVGFIELLITREKREFYQFSLGFSFAGFMFANIFLLLFAAEMFSIEHKNLRFFILVNLTIAISLILPWNYYGILKENYPMGFSIRPYTATAMALFSVITYLRIFIWAYKVSTRIENRLGRVGFQFIAISQLCMIGFFVLMVADMVYFAISEVLTGYTIFNHLAWVAAAGFFVFSYVGFVMPEWVKNIIKKVE